MLHLSQNNQYFMEDNQPFFMLADTAWLMFFKLDIADIKCYMKNRAEKGYNVILAILSHESGDFALRDNHLQINMDDEIYWSKVEAVVQLASELDIYMGLLPGWGSIVKKGILTEDNIESYSHFLGKKFQKYENIVWIMGGDIRAANYMGLYKKEREILKTYNPNRLISFHPFGRTSSTRWFQDEESLDFNLFQSGHRRYDQVQLGEWDDALSEEIFYGEDNWRYVEQDLALSPLRPVLDGEPSYEGIPQGLHNPRNPYWEEWDVRRYAYWSAFEGAAGHTYGNNAIIQFYNEGDQGAYGVRETWKDALHHSGGSQLKYLKELMLSVDFIKGSKREDLLLFGQKERYHRIAVFAGVDYILCYDYLGDEFMLDLQEYKHQRLEGYWMNPQDGTYSYMGDYENVDKALFSPVRRQGPGNDWVLLLRVKNRSL